MYIWVGANIDNQLIEIKNNAKEIENIVGFSNSNFTLPLHISLKISFHVDDEIGSKVIDTITQYYNTLKPFTIEIKEIEKHTSIIWIKMKENNEIKKIHDELDEILLKKYKIELHPYDLNYQFHSTLFMDENKEKLNKAYDLLKNISVPSTLLLNNFLIGTSQNGIIGTYKVIRLVQL